jgi:hypothetical protein
MLQIRNVNAALAFRFTDLNQLFDCRLHTRGTLETLQIRRVMLERILEAERADAFGQKGLLQLAGRNDCRTLALR